MSNDELIARFFGYMRAERGSAENTIESYGLDLRKLSEWFSGPLTKIKREDLSSYLVKRMDDGASPRTAVRSLKTFRSFFRFLIDDDEISHDPTIGVPLPRYAKPLPNIARQSDVDKMVASLGDSPLAVRDGAMQLMLFGSGLRVSELAALKLKDIDMDAGIVKVWGGKGGKDAVLPLSDAAILALKRYLAEVRPGLAGFGCVNLGPTTLWKIAKGLKAAPQPAPSPYLFLAQRCGNRMTRQNIQQRVQAIGKAALGRNISPHQLRHGFGTVLVENNADILDVQALMRHARIETTQIYLQLDLNYLKEKYDASHPRARIANQNPGLFDALPGAQPESTFHPRLPRRPPRLCGLHGASGHLPNQPKENPQLPSAAA